MAEIIKVYRQSYPDLRLIGKCYHDADRGPLGGFGSLWEEWYYKQYNKTLRKLGYLPESEGSTVGWMSFTEGLEYWTGMLFPPDTPVPEGFQSSDITKGELGVCWIYGSLSSGDLFGEHILHLCLERLKKEGLEVADRSWFFERYVYPRFVIPDEHGKVILDYCIYLKDSSGR